MNLTYSKMTYVNDFTRFGAKRSGKTWMLRSDAVGRNITFVPYFGSEPKSLCDFDVYVDGIADEDVGRLWFDASQEVDPIAALVKALEAFKSSKEEDNSAPGFSDTAEEFPEQLPKMEVDVRRDLYIYTYGSRHGTPQNSEYTFNAAVLHGNRRSMDLHKLRGTDEEVQKSVMGSKNFYEFMEAVIRTIEAKNLHIVSIICAKGHHRSVACAELLAKHYYRNAVTHHLTLNK